MTGENVETVSYQWFYRGCPLGIVGTNAGVDAEAEAAFPALCASLVRCVTFLIVPLQDCLEQFDIGMEVEGLPDNVAVIKGPRSQREVLCPCLQLPTMFIKRDCSSADFYNALRYILTAGLEPLGTDEAATHITGLKISVLPVQVHLSVKGMALVCATTWWNTAEISRYLGESKRPIWSNLASNCKELFREVTQLYCGYSPELQRCEDSQVSCLLQHNNPRPAITMHCTCTSAVLRP